MIGAPRNSNETKATMPPALTVYSINGVTPVVDPSAFVHPSAVLIGDVIVGAGCYIGPCAALRGDFGRIEIRAGANLQDSCVAHGFPGTDTVVAEDGHIGHCAVLHGCVVERNALVGMNAVINDNAVIGESAIVGAMAFVKARMIVPPRLRGKSKGRKATRSLHDAVLRRCVRRRRYRPSRRTASGSSCLICCRYRR